MRSGARLRPDPRSPAAVAHTGFLMNTLLNIIWLVLSGFWLFLGYAVAALVMFVLILTIPWGIAAWRVGVYALWPFGKTIVDKPTAGVGSFLGNVVWVILAGWWLAIGHIVTGLLLCITIIGIPLGIANFKLVPVSLMPLGKDIVDIR
ncbi:hypothetical protein GCM10025877_16660 [Agromyces mangrovi Wang et al. 2018]|nr:hypothetical protein GCM10025877_16660 [Agromyces mangrovi]